MTIVKSIQFVRMCGRNSLFVDAEKLKDRYIAELDSYWKGSYNISPGKRQPVVTKNSPTRIQDMVWDFVPGFVEEDEHSKFRSKTIINARADSLESNRMFRPYFQKNKCLVPSTGFYEWKDEGKPQKTPYHIKPEKGQVFSFAGFYANNTFVIITKESENQEMKDIHSRTPVIIPKNQESEYINDELSSDDLQSIVASKLDIDEVSKEVNDPKNDYKEILNKDTKQTRLG